jgi:hypothetical protein
MQARVLTFAAQAPTATQGVLKVFTRLTNLYKEDFAIDPLTVSASVLVQLT